MVEKPWLNRAAAYRTRVQKRNGCIEFPADNDKSPLPEGTDDRQQEPRHGSLARYDIPAKHFTSNEYNSPTATEHRARNACVGTGPSTIIV